MKQPEKVISDQEDDITEYQFKFFTTQRYKAKYEKIYENLLALMKDQGITISQKPIDVADFWTVYFAWWNYSDKAADIKKVTSQLLLNSLYSIKTYTVNNQTLWLKVTNSTRKMDIIWPNALRVMARFECNTYGTRLKGDNNFAPEALKKYADFVYEGTEVSNRVKYFKNVLIKRKEDQGIIDRLEEKYTMIDDFIYFFSDHPNREDMDYMVPRLIQYLKGEMIDIRPDN